jgi:hypothetical protein
MFLWLTETTRVLLLLSNTKATVYKSLTRLVLVSASESWTLTKSHEKALDIFVRKY